MKSSGFSATEEQLPYLSRGTERIPRVPLGFVDKVQHAWSGGVTGTQSGLQVKFKWR